MSDHELLYELPKKEVENAHHGHYKMETAGCRMHAPTLRDRAIAMVEMRGALLVLPVLLSCLCKEISGIPIPGSYDGFAYSPHSTDEHRVLLEAFIDPVCPDCRTAWPTLKQLTSVYRDRLWLIVHPFPVPFHTNAFFTARALHIADILNSTTTYPFLELIFQKQESFWNDISSHQSPVDIVEELVELAVALGIPEEYFRAGFTDPVTDQAARISFKFGCSRGVTATPSYLVNGVAVGADETWNVRQWRELLDPVVDGKALSLGRWSHSQPIASEQVM